MGFWIEIRPLRTAKEVNPESLRGILDVLHNTGKPFRFIAAGVSDPELMGKKTVRFFFEFPDEETKKYFKNLFTSSLNVEVHEEAPPRLSFERCVDLELARHFAHPAVRPESSSIFPLDGICSALADGGAFEVVACGDVGAKTSVHQFVYDRMHGKPSFTKAVADAAFDVYQEAAVQRDIKDVSREAWWSYRRYKDDKWVQKEVADAERKMHENLFTCEVRLYGDKVQVENMKQALPSGMNRFKAFRTLRKVFFPQPLKKPRRIMLRNILNPLWWIAPLGIAAASWYFGILDPFRLETVDLAILVGSALTSAVLAFILRRKNPIVLSTSEISAIVGLPRNLGRLPLRFGTSAFSTKPLPDIPADDSAYRTEPSSEEEMFVPAVKIEELANEEDIEEAGEEEGLEEEGLEEEGLEEEGVEEEGLEE